MFKTEGFRKYLRNTSWMFADRMIRLGAVLVTGIFMARYLKPEGFGQLNYASGFVGLFFALTSMGLDEIVVRDLVRHPEKRDEILGSSALLKFFGALLLMILVMAGTLLNHMTDYTTMMVMIIALSELAKPAMVIDYYFQSQVMGSQSAMVNILQTLASSSFKLVLVAIKAPLMWFAWSYLVDMLMFTIVAIIYYERHGLALRAWRATRTMFMHLLEQSWPLIIFGVALFVQARIDQVMIFDVLKHTSLGEKGANAEVGQYSVALKMIEALGFLPVIIQKSLAPAITRAKLEDPAKYEDRLLNQYRLMFLMFLITAVPLYFLAQPIIIWFYGPAYTTAGYLLGLFAIRLFFTNMGVGKTSFITNESLFKYSLLTAVIGAGLNIAINYYLIPIYLSKGAIWATIISFFISIFILDLFFKSTRRNFVLMVKGIATFWKLHNAR